jgi:hypothetical protein
MFYMDVESTLPAMRCAAGYKREDTTDAGGRQNIPCDDVRGVFFGSIVQQLKTAMRTVSDQLQQRLPPPKQKATTSVTRTHSPSLQGKSSCTTRPSSCLNGLIRSGILPPLYPAAYCQRSAFLILLIEQVLCQDAPILRWRYKDLPRWQCPVFETPSWRTHEIRAVQHWTSHRGLAPYVLTEQGMHNMLQNTLRDQLTAFLQASRFTAQPAMLPLLSRPPQLLPDTALPSAMHLAFWPPTPLQASLFPPAIFSSRAASAPRIVQPEDYPNLEKIRQRGQGHIPFQVFLYFWIGQPTHASEAMWPCTFAELQSRNPRDLKF